LTEFSALLGLRQWRIDLVDEIVGSPSVVNDRVEAFEQLL